MSWQIICRSLKEEENSLLIQALKSIVHDAEDLGLIDIQDLKRIADRGFLLQKTKLLLYRYFNDWTVFSLRVPGLSGEALNELKTVAPVPSYLLNLEEDELSECSKLSYVAKNFTIKKVNEFFDKKHWNNLLTVEDYQADSESTDIEELERTEKAQFRKLYENFFQRQQGWFLVRNETIVDNNKETTVTKGYTTTPKLLLKEYLYNCKECMAIDFAIGTIENLDQDTMDLLKRYDAVELVDISDNRITEKDKENITTILGIVSKNNGALVIHDNPIVTKQQCPNTYFQDLALTNPSNFLRLIWLKKSELEDYAMITRVLGRQVSEKIKRDVIRSHKAFYSYLAELMHGCSFHSTKLYQLRLLKD